MLKHSKERTTGPNIYNVLAHVHPSAAPTISTEATIPTIPTILSIIASPSVQRSQATWVRVQRTDVASSSKSKGNLIFVICKCNFNYDGHKNAGLDVVSTRAF